MSWQGAVHELIYAYKGFLMIGNNENCPIKGIGSIRWKVVYVCKLLLTGVLKRNLISLGALKGRVYEFKSDNGKLMICRGNDIIMKGIKHKNLYYMDSKPVIDDLDVIVNSDTALWHRRLDHVSEKGLMELEKQLL